jgi:chromate reductase
VIDFLSQLAQADAVIICTPEYIFSPPGVLKNALEWTVASSGFSGKSVALIVAATAGEKAFESLQLIMKTIEARFNEKTMLMIQGTKR